jgi:hypothetical protein
MMSLARLLVAAAAICASGSLSACKPARNAGALTHEASVEYARLIVEAPPEVTFGHAAPVKVRLENRGTEAILLPSERWGPFGKLTTAGGTRVPCGRATLVFDQNSGVGRHLLQVGDPPVVLPESTIAPGTAIDLQFDLFGEFEIQHPGLYRLSAWIDVSGFSEDGMLRRVVVESIPIQVGGLR